MILKLPVFEGSDVTKSRFFFSSSNVFAGGLVDLGLNQPDVDGLSLFSGLELVDVEQDEVVLAREVAKVAVVGLKRNLETHA